MQLTLPIILIALGGLALITQRNRWIVLVALLVQWVGLTLQISAHAGSTTVALVEGVTAVGCCAIFALTVRSLGRSAKEKTPSTRGLQAAIADQVWLWAIALVAGVAGFGLAQLYSLGGSQQDLLAFYWIVLPAMLALVIDGSRDPVKLAASTLSLFNAGLLLVYTLSASPPSVSLLALAALCRLAVAAISGHNWLFLKTTYADLNLNTLFDLRDSKIATETALAIVPQHFEQVVAPVSEEQEQIEGADDNA